VLERPLEGVEAKIDRAGEHLERVRDDSRRFFEREPYRVTVDLEPETGWYVAHVRIKEQPPIALSVIVGEFAYECISALNHAVWQLASRKRGRIKVEGIKEQIQFPIALSPSRFAEKGLIKNGHVSKKAVAVISELQAYQGWRGEAGAETHPLSVLKELADSDKHRVLAPQLGSVDFGKLTWEWNPGARDPEEIDHLRRGQSLDDGTQLKRIRFRVGNDKAKVHVDGDLSPEIAFGAGEWAIHIRNLESGLVNMKRCLNRLATLFP
jgi:hypothetical protein